MTNVGYTLMTEQSGPKDLVRWAVGSVRMWDAPDAGVPIGSP